ncbi:MAG: MotA/TolQ/ExbB proton channel family protein [Pirellulales bacterium]
MAREKFKQFLLDWQKRDIEQRLLFPGGRYTRVNNLLSGLLGLLLTGLFYGTIGNTRIAKTAFGQIFLERGETQHLVVLLTFWSLCILAIKYLKLRLQRKSLELQLIPDEAGFTVSPTTAGQVLKNIYDQVDDPKHFMLTNRIVMALSNLRNLGRVGDVDEILRSQASQDESAMETSYSLLQGFIWAIPVLGFIGTVLGLSKAIGGFSNVLKTTDDITQISDSLQGVTGGLATAFDTTLIALIAALIIQLIMVVLKKAEEEFHDEALEYGIQKIVGRLRLEN